MERYMVFAWDRETGDVVFFESNAITSRNLFLMRVDAPCSIHDPWSESLLRSASNRSEIIHKYIEMVQRHSQFSKSQIGGENNMLRDATDWSWQLLAPYAYKSTKGAFIPKVQKDGEIDSFLKIKEYLDDDNVCHAILADPYFSVPSAAKLLTRIANIDLELTIVSSLNYTDPDSEEK